MTINQGNISCASDNLQLETRKIENKNILYFLPIIFVVGLFMFTSCKKNNDKILPNNTAKIIGHKGSGPINEFGNKGILENTWQSIYLAMNTLDGSEIDLQMSSDSTIWIFHDHEILDCNNNLKNFTTLTDLEIQEYNECNYSSLLITFSDFIHRASLEPWANKILCLDLKLLYNPMINELIEENHILQNLIINEFKQASQISKLDLIYETYSLEDFNAFNAEFEGKVTLVNHDPTLEFIIENNSINTPISLPVYNLPEGAESIQADIRNIWTVNDFNQFIYSLNFNPKYIQTDNIPLGVFIKKLQANETPIIETIEYEFLGTEEYFNIITYTSEAYPLKNELFNIEIVGVPLDKNVLIALSGRDENDETIYWEGHNVNLREIMYIFINPDFLNYKGVKTIKITVWNKNQQELNHKFRVKKLSF